MTRLGDLRRHRRRAVLGTVTAVACALSLAAPAAADRERPAETAATGLQRVASLPSAGAWLSGEAAALPNTLEGSAAQASRSTVARLGGEGRTTGPLDGDVDRFGVDRFGGVEDRFTDTCEDAGDAPDLRRTSFAYDFDAETLTITIRTCGEVLEELRAGVTTILMGDDDTAAPRRRLVIERDGDGLRATLLDARGTSAVDDDTRIADVDVARTARDGDRNVQLVVDGGDLAPLVSRCRGFVPPDQSVACFTLAATSAAGDDRDSLPEPDEPLLVFPDSCDFELFDQRTVRTEPGRRDEAAAAARAAGLHVRAETGDAFAVTHLRGDASAIAELPGVVAVDPAHGVQQHLVPDDEGFDQQWQLPLLGAPTAWDVTTGSSDVRLAVVDDGIDATRHDLRGRVGVGRDIVRDRALVAGRDSDRGGHGTQVAAIMAATGNNAGSDEPTDIAGVDWNATLLPVRIFDAAGCASDADVAAGIDTAVDLGADVVNLSLGTRTSPAVLDDAVARAEARGVVLVASTGNEGTFSTVTNFPAAYSSVVAVGASTSGDGGAPERVARYSNASSDTFVVAPGGDSSFSDPASTELLTLTQAEDFGYVSGTSFSSPLVAGAVGLLRARDRCLTPLDVRERLAATAVELPSDDSDRTPDGRRTASGHGRLDIAGLVTGDGLGDDRPPAVDDTAIEVPAGTPATFRLPVQPCGGDDETTDVRVVDGPSDGAVTLDGLDMTYTPASRAEGDDAVTVEATVAGTDRTETATVTLERSAQVRLSASDRFATAAAIAASSAEAGVDVVHVASGADFPDALSASAAAGAAGGPVLLVQPDRVPRATAEELLRLRPGRIVLVGGPGAVARDVERTLAAYAGDDGVTRLSGSDRFATSVEVSGSAFPDGASRVVVATGASFPDALAGAPPAILGDAPLLLTRPDAVPEVVADELARLGPSEVLLLGGTAAVDDATATAIAEAAGGASVVRLAGRDRFATAAEVSAERFGAPRSTVFVATGQAFPDALAGGVAAASVGAPLLLVPSTGPVPASVLAELNRLDPASVVILGGEAAVSSPIATALSP